MCNKRKDKRKTQEAAGVEMERNTLRASWRRWPWVESVI